jgi:hypothetical protein
MRRCRPRSPILNFLNSCNSLNSFSRVCVDGLPHLVFLGAQTPRTTNQTISPKMLMRKEPAPQVDPRVVWYNLWADTANHLIYQKLALKADGDRKRWEIVIITTAFSFSIITLIFSFVGQEWSTIVTRISAAMTVLLSGLGGVLQLKEAAKELKAHRDKLFSLSYHSERVWNLARDRSQQENASAEADAADKERLSIRQSTPLCKVPDALAETCFQRASKILSDRYTHK